MDDNSAMLKEVGEHWKERVVRDIDEIRRIKVDLLKLSAAREDTELAEIAHRLHIARCNLANTITLRFLVNGIQTNEQDEDCKDEAEPA
jgi:hypothetical protein